MGEQVADREQGPREANRAELPREDEAPPPLSLEAYPPLNAAAAEDEALQLHLKSRYSTATAKQMYSFAPRSGRQGPPAPPEVPVLQSHRQAGDQRQELRFVQIFASLC